jgi:hypothetical protein
MIELRKLRGKLVLISGDNAVNDILVLYPELFPYKSVEQIYMEFPQGCEFSLTSPDNVDTDYRTLAANTKFNISSISVTNVKIKSVNGQIGYIYTAGI